MMAISKETNMLESANSIADFWYGEFSLPSLSPTTVSVDVKPAFDRSYRAMILELPDGETRAVVTPEISALLGGAPSDVWTSAELKIRLADIGVVLKGPDFVFYFSKTAVAALHHTPADASIRVLTDEDHAIFAAFEAEASQEDLDGATVGLDDWLVLGAFEDGRLVAAASMFQWNDAPIADVGVLTLNSARRKGYAARLIRASAIRALTEGFSLQYRCQSDNLASIALAKSLGLAQFGTWIAELRDENVDDH